MRSIRATRFIGSSLPNTAPAPVAQAVNGIIYVFSEKSTFAYDPKTDKWTRKASIPAGSFSCVNTVAAVVNGVVYLFGGISIDSQCAYDVTLAYDPVKDGFAAKRKRPVPCALPGCANIDGKIYHAGGASGIPTTCPDATISQNPPEHGRESPTLRTSRQCGASRKRLSTWRGCFLDDQRTGAHRNSRDD